MNIDHSQKILVVDDEPTMRMIIERILRQMQFSHVVLASDGKQAMDKLEKEPYALVVADWNMPNLSGLELLRAIRANPKLQTIPVLMVTAEDNHQKVLEAIKAGVNHYILKPFTTTQFEEKVGQILGRSQ